MPSSTSKSKQAQAAVDLKVIRETGQRFTQTITEGRLFMVGSASHHGLCLDAPGVASTHCTLALRNGSLHVRDWNSETGTFVNDRRIDAETVARPGDVIRIGPCRIEVPAATFVERQAPEPASSTETEQIGSLDCDSRLDIMLGALAPAKSDAKASVSSSKFTVENPPAAEPVAVPETVEEVQDFWAPADDALGDEPIAAADDDWFAEFANDEEPSREGDSLLQEIEFLRRELSDRDSRLVAFELAEPASSAGRGQEPGGKATVQSLSARLDQVLKELEQSDERATLLTNLLERSEEENRTARQEREQIENWIAEIEKLFSAKEAEWHAERDLCQKRLEQANKQREQLEQRLERHAQGGGSAASAQTELLQGMKREISALRQSLDEAARERDLAVSRLKQAGSGQGPTPQVQIDAALREERLKLAEERADLARLRSELVQAVPASAPAPVTATATAVEALPAAKPNGERSDPRQADYKIRAFREHLRELHQTEPPPPAKQNNVSNRLGKLWRKLNGTPLDTD